MAEKLSTRKTTKKPKPRCTNCGDETYFSDNVDPRREQRGWCVPCWRQFQNFIPFGRPLPDGRTGFWKDEDRSLYDEGRSPWTQHAPHREEG